MGEYESNVSETAIQPSANPLQEHRTDEERETIKWILF